MSSSINFLTEVSKNNFLNFEEIFNNEELENFNNDEEIYQNGDLSIAQGKNYYFLYNFYVFR